jgi:hypothetical protein
MSKECLFCDCGDRATISGLMLFPCPVLWPDLELIFILLLQTLLIVTIHRQISCLVFMVYQCEFEEFMYNNVPCTKL